MLGVDAGGQVGAGGRQARLCKHLKSVQEKVKSGGTVGRSSGEECRRGRDRREGAGS